MAAPLQTMTKSAFDGRLPNQMKQALLRPASLNVRLLSPPPRINCSIWLISLKNFSFCAFDK
jgi:hypothetical protein